MEILLDDLKNELTRHIEKTLSTMTKRPGKDAVEALLSWDRARGEFSDLVSAVGNLKGKKLLEIGCGYGLFLAVCLKNKVLAEGVEPAEEKYYKTTLRMGREVLTRAGFNPKLIKKGVGESLPYNSESFDIVVSLFTLEHVQCVKKVFEESIRVLKPGGLIYFVVPNYGSFWESHYSIIWPPYIPKVLAKIYVKILGKDPVLINELQLVNYFSIKNSINNLPLEVLDWGKNTFYEKVTKLNLPDLNTVKSAKKVLLLLKRMKVLKLAATFLNIINAQTPIILIARKKKS